MSRWLKKLALLGIALALLLPTTTSWGRGGGGMRGGGGGGNRGGGNFGGAGARPSPNMSRGPSMSSPSMNRPASRPSMPSASRPGQGGKPNLPSGMNRPQGGGGSAMTRPGTVNRPGPSGNRPQTLPGTGAGAGNRPDIGTRPGTNRPGQGGGLASNRPGVWDRPGNDQPTTLPGRPGPGNLPGTGNRPGTNRPGTLPGLGNRPGLDDGPAGNRPNWGDRPIAGNLNDLHQNNLNNIHNNFNINQEWHNHQGNFQNWQSNHPNWHEDWHDWNHNWHHDDWCHGHWHGNYNNYWNSMWNTYPAAAAFGLTAWGVNRASYWFGYAPYYNPYWVPPAAAVPTYVDYSQPIIVSQPITQETLASADGGSALPPGVAPESVSTFDQARQSFASGNYSEALKLTDQALKDAPRDAAIHEFRALTLFAIGKYKEAAATLHSVLAVGPGWDWTTLIGLYGGSSAIYTDQLRALESFVKKNPSRADAHFVLAYHYLTAGHADAAAKEFRLVCDAQSKDTVSAQLLEMLTGTKPGSTEPPPAPEPVDSVHAAIPAAALEGTWKSQGTGGAKFSLSLNDKKDFTWTYSQGKKTETVQGVYDIDGDTLALTPDGGGVMLAQVTEPQDGQFHFQMIGAPDGDKGLDFKK